MMALVTRGLGTPGGLLVSGGMGQVIYVSPSGETYARHNGSWRRVSEMHVWHGGGWRRAELYAYKSGAWVKTW